MREYELSECCQGCGEDISGDGMERAGGSCTQVGHPKRSLIRVRLLKLLFYGEN
jgi:hypothetical protein